MQNKIIILVLIILNLSILNAQSNEQVTFDVSELEILEDEIISTKASKESLNTEISLNAAKFVLDKVYLFMRKQ